MRCPRRGPGALLLAPVQLRQARREGVQAASRQLRGPVGAVRRSRRPRPTPRPPPASRCSRRPRPAVVSSGPAPVSLARTGISASSESWCTRCQTARSAGSPGIARRSPRVQSQRLLGRCVRGGQCLSRGPLQRVPRRRCVRPGGRRGQVVDPLPDPDGQERRHRVLLGAEVAVEGAQRDAGGAGDLLGGDGGAALGEQGRRGTGDLQLGLGLAPLGEGGAGEAGRRRGGAVGMGPAYGALRQIGASCECGTLCQSGVPCRHRIPT